MVKKDKILSFTISEDIISQALKDAIFSWTKKEDRARVKNPYKRLQNAFTGYIMENCFISYLKDKNIKFELIEREEDHSRQDIKLKDRFCNLKGFVLDFKKKFLIDKHIDELIPKNAQWLLDCTGLVPMKDFNPKESTERTINRLFVFYFLKCTLTPPNNEEKKGILHLFCSRKINKGIIRHRKDSGKDLGKIQFDITPEIQEQYSLLVYGINSDNEEITETIIIENGGGIKTENEYASLIALKSEENTLPPPLTTITVKTESGLIRTIPSNYGFKLKQSRGKPLELIKNAWKALYIYEPEVYLAGFIEEADLRMEGMKISLYDKTIKQYPEIKFYNWGIKISEIEPIEEIKKFE
jgi:hypothetical protein